MKGVYLVWSVDRQRVYVGESTNLAQRKQQHGVAILLGCAWEIVKLCSDTTSVSELYRLEAALAAALRQRGVVVVSNTQQEKAAKARAARKVLTKEQRRKQAVGMCEYWRKATPAQRTARSRKAYAAGIGKRRLATSK